jgi:glucose-6-phosphate isomerase
MDKKIMEPYSAILSFTNGFIKPFKNKVEVRLSDLKDYFQDKKAVKQILSKGEDPVIYLYFEHTQEEIQGHLNFGVTIINSGKIGREYYLTRGHYHAKKEAAEVYVGLKGKGIMIMQNEDGQVVHLPISKGIVVYVPPFWAHRTVNIGKKELAFFYVYPSNAGHTYDAIRKMGFAKLVVEENKKPKVIDNVNFEKL